MAAGPHTELRNMNDELEFMRKADNSQDLRDALSIIAIMLVDADQRKIFQKCDGVTTIIDHLTRLWEEQRINVEDQVRPSLVFGFPIESEDIPDFVFFSVIGIGHMAMDQQMSLQIGSSSDNVISSLMNKALVENDTSPKLRLALVEALRNLWFQEQNHRFISSEFLDFLWATALSNKAPSKLLQEAAILALINLSTNHPKKLQVNQEHIKTLLRMFLHCPTMKVKIAVADLCCNLAQDSEYGVMMIFELDELKPDDMHNHSGIVYALQLCESFTDEGLRSATEAMAHNLAYTDVKGKRKIQRLGAASFVSQLILNQEQQHNETLDNAATDDDELEV